MCEKMKIINCSTIDYDYRELISKEVEVVTHLECEWNVVRYDNKLYIVSEVDMEDIIEDVSLSDENTLIEKKECPLGGDTNNNCKGCFYSSDFQFKDGECVRKADDEPTIEIQTPKGLLKATLVIDKFYPGIRITVDGELIACVECMCEDPEDVESSILRTEAYVKNQDEPDTFTNWE